MRNLLVIVLLFCFSIAFSQIKLTGKILNQNHKPIEFAEVLLLNKDSVAIKSELSDEKGFFSLDTKQGNYIFQIKQSKEITYTKNIEVSNNLDLGTIKTESTTNLQEVVIQGKKKLIERKVDRIVYNVSNDIFNKGSNLMDALHRAPRLNVEQDKISIIGKEGNVKIMIDGRLQNLSDEALKAKLKGLRTEQIAKVEIIPTPPARYSAEGNSGMINIILKKDENLGLQGSANTDVGVQFGKVSPAQGINLNYKMKKLDATVNFSHNDTKGTNINKLTYDFDKTTTIIENLPDFDFKNTSFNTVLQYKLNSKINIGTTLDFGKANNKINALGTSQYYNKILQKSDSLMYSKNLSNEDNNSKAISLYTDYTIDSLGKKISLTYNYSYNKNLSDSHNTAEIIANNLMKNTAFTNLGANRYQINGALLDFELPFKFGRIETGGAYTAINNNTSISYYNQQNLLDINRNNEFEYTEKTMAVYLSFQKEWSKKWTSKIGLRLENTDIKGFSQTLSITNRNNYTKLFPTLFISYNPNDNHAFSFSYSKRLDRPSFYDLNPFRYYTNAYNYLSGNPSLLPTYTNVLELSYTLKNNLNFIAYGNYITDGISYLNEINADKSYVVHPVNNYTQKKIGLIGSYTWSILKWNSLYINAEGYYTDLTSQKSVQEIKGLGGSFSLRNSIKLNKAKTSLLELSYTNYLPSKAQYSDYTAKNQARFDINFKQMFLNNDLVFNLYINDIFRQNINKSEKQYDTFHYSQYNDTHNKGIFFSVSYNFGNKKVNGIYRDTKNKDKNRGGK